MLIRWMMIKDVIGLFYYDQGIGRYCKSDKTYFNIEIELQSKSGKTNDKKQTLIRYLVRGGYLRVGGLSGVGVIDNGRKRGLNP